MIEKKNDKQDKLTNNIRIAQLKIGNKQVQSFTYISEKHDRINTNSPIKYMRNIGYFTSVWSI